MAGTALEISIDSAQLQQLQKRLERLAGAFDDRTELLEAIGAKVASQTQRRIHEEKAAPDGTPWPEWSDAHARTRHGGQSLLEAEGDLLQDIRHQVDGDLAEVGTNLIYAATHQFGDEGRGIPAREYLGIGSGSLAELDAELDRWAAGRLSEALA